MMPLGGTSSLPIPTSMPTVRLRFAAIDRCTGWIDNTRAALAAPAQMVRLFRSFTAGAPEFAKESAAHDE